MAAPSVGKEPATPAPSPDQPGPSRKSEGVGVGVAPGGVGAWERLPARLPHDALSLQSV